MTRNTAILGIESTRRIRSSAALLVVLTIFSILYLSIFPSFKEDAEDLAEAFPGFFYDMFDIEALHTIEGFIAAEIFSFFWTVIVAVYFAYIGATMVSVDIHERRMDLTLSNPIKRESVVVQKLLSLWVPLAILNIGLFVLLLAGSNVINEPLDPIALAMVHLLSIPYLLVCTAIGLLLSVWLSHPRSSKAAAVALVLVLWLVDAVSRMTPDYRWIGDVTPSRYYEHTAILVRQEYSLFDAGLLLLVFSVLVVIATALFLRKDI